MQFFSFYYIAGLPTSLCPTQHMYYWCVTAARQLLHCTLQLSALLAADLLAAVIRVTVSQGSDSRRLQHQLFMYVAHPCPVQQASVCHLVHGLST
jgi:hypothetical protein